ncbi:universal stress protein [filamentous cyanobacterium LEGE 07170]|nr:universal stress protein [filamentous cyanobacterium LEGE 07170]
MFESALICTDFTDGLYRLVRFVPQLAESGLKKLVFLHVVPLAEGAVPRPDEAGIQVARDRLSSGLDNIPDGVEVTVEVKSGTPSVQIAEVLRSQHVELVILGTPGRSLLSEKLFGSTMINVCQRLTIPLMILRPNLISTYTNAELALRCQNLFHHLLLPYDDSETARYTLERIKTKAQAGHPLKHCLLCWVVDEVRRNAQLREYEEENAAKVLAQRKQELEELGIDVRTEVLVGNPLTEILEMAVDVDISAIASASRNVGKLIELSVRSLTGELLRKSWHPVIYFPIR